MTSRWSEADPSQNLTGQNPGASPQRKISVHLAQNIFRAWVMDGAAINADRGQAGKLPLQTQVGKTRHNASRVTVLTSWPEIDCLTDL
jgi:hypothetical protein